MSLLSLLIVSAINFTGSIVVPTDQVPPTVTTTTVQSSADPLLTYELASGSVVVETRVYP
ncbi:MAG: hypothetical protein V4641_05825 [Pseudomonadota bacterium]